MVGSGYLTPRFTGVGRWAQQNLKEYYRIFPPAFPRPVQAIVRLPFPSPSLHYPITPINILLFVYTMALVLYRAICVGKVLGVAQIQDLYE
jgi:hypothetical protein